MSYYPRRPVKSFQDLEVYQKLLAIAVIVVKGIPPKRPAPEVARPLESGDKSQRDILSKDQGNIGSGTVAALHECALSLPIKIAAAHSLRFGNTEQAIRILEEIMVGCNKIVVYLELYRDLYNSAPEVATGVDEASDNETGTGGHVIKDNGNIGSGTIELEFFEEQIKNILSIRFKILHLQRSWIKFTPSIGKK